mgnify:CR=1 FL=1
MQAFVATSKVIGLNLEPAKLTEKDCGAGGNRSHHPTRLNKVGSDPASL